MRLTNNLNLPESIFKFLSNDLYDGVRDKNTYSATELLKPTREIVLTRRHWEKLEVDCSERMWSLFGQGVHAILENEEGVEPIERISVELGDKVISGKFDRLKDNVLYDYKVTSAWTIVYGSRLVEWAEQLSIYRWLYWRKYKKELDAQGRIVAILRDWDQKEIMSGRRYPASPVVEIKLNLMSLKATEAFITDKLAEIAQAQKTLPLCTPEERWWNEKKKVFNKCMRYCNAREFCDQAKAAELAS